MCHFHLKRVNKSFIDIIISCFEPILIICQWPGFTFTHLQGYAVIHGQFGVLLCIHMERRWCYSFCLDYCHACVNINQRYSLVQWGGVVAVLKSSGLGFPGRFSVNYGNQKHNSCYALLHFATTSNSIHSLKSPFQRLMISHRRRNLYC